MRSVYIIFLNIGLSLIFSCSTAEKESKQPTKKESQPITLLKNRTKQQIGLQYLSEYGFFEGTISELKPTKGVIPYELNSTLFSDYAHKARFVKFPAGISASYHPTEVMNFPVGTILIKNFYYPIDFRHPKGEKRIVETRLLIHKEEGWQALPYVWNEEQTEASLQITGATKAVSWINDKGVQINLDYSVPNMNQCRSCHLYNNKIKPIGPTARQLNKDYPYSEGIKMNQLAHWQALGHLNELPRQTDWPKLVSYEDTSASLDDRARAYLEINCGHCHRKEGPAKNSALELLTSVNTPAAWGIGKTPIAAGKGSGGLKYDIVPGKPHQSILWYRMNATDPGIMMPELGRKMVHVEGVELIKEWILSM